MSDLLAWWLAGAVSGFGVGTVAGIAAALYPYWPDLSQVFSRDAGTRPRLRRVKLEILHFALRGIVFGSVTGYLMVWLSPLLHNWPMRFVVGAIVGTLVSAFSAPGTAREEAGRQGIAGLIASLITVAWVKSLAEFFAH